MLKAMHCSLFNYGISFDVQVRPSPYLSGVWHPECSDSEYLISLSSSLLFLFTLHICVLPFVNLCVLLCASQTLIPSHSWALKVHNWINVNKLWPSLAWHVFKTFARVGQIFILICPVKNGLYSIFLGLAFHKPCLCMQEWLAPLPDKSLPHYNIRESLLRVLGEVGSAILR